MRTDVQAERKADPVVAWRRNQLTRSGFPRPLAERLARDPDYDLHLLISLVERHCPPSLAVRIAAPLHPGGAA